MSTSSSSRADDSRAELFNFIREVVASGKAHTQEAQEGVKQRARKFLGHTRKPSFTGNWLEHSSPNEDY